jgi:hypothetical protein
MRSSGTNLDEMGSPGTIINGLWPLESSSLRPVGPSCTILDDLWPMEPLGPRPLGSSGLQHLGPLGPRPVRPVDMTLNTVGSPGTFLDGLQAVDQNFKQE